VFGYFYPSGGVNRNIGMETDDALCLRLPERREATYQ
jgi:hypothetical protein